MTQYISIGKILNFHGIKGEVKVGYTKGREQQISSLKQVVISIAGNEKILNVVSVRFHKQYALIKFTEINSINEVELIKGLEIKIPKDEVANNLSDDEFLVNDLVGLNVFNADGEKVGTISNIGSNGASEIIEIIDANNKIHLIPFVKELVPVVDINNKHIIINDIKGLIE